MIYVTGDVHGLEEFKKLHIFAGEHPELTLDDYVIVAGDFGAVWSERTIAENMWHYKQLPFTVLFVDGNHENFDLLESYPIETWKGGKVHVIRPNVIHLMRGQVFEIEGNTIFTFGGATSIDRACRTEGRSWWRQEVPTFEEMDEGFENLKRYGNKVDYIITHSCCERALAYPKLRFSIGEKKYCPEVHILSNFDATVEFKHWYFGHFHMDEQLSDKYTVLLHDIVRLGDVKEYV